MEEEEETSMGAQTKPDYEAIATEEYRYGKEDKKFIEVARKKVEDTEFISISKGYYDKMGNKRYKGGLGFPDEGEIKEFIVNSLKKV